METKTTSPKNESIVKLLHETNLINIFKRHRTFDEVLINAKAKELSEAEGVIDSLQPEPKSDTAFTFRVNDVVHVVPYEAINISEFEARTTAENASAEEEK